jgi:hypothetical protein
MTDVFWPAISITGRKLAGDALLDVGATTTVDRSSRAVV